MIGRVYGFLGRGFLIGVGVVAAFGLGYILRPIPDPAVPVPNNEQLVRTTSTLISWLDHHDQEALAYDFPNFLGCTVTKRLRLSCVYGITYLDESTRRYTVVLDRDNRPVRFDRTRRSAIPTSP